MYYTSSLGMVGEEKIPVHSLPVPLETILPGHIHTVCLPGCTTVCPAPDHGADTPLAAGVTVHQAQEGDMLWVVPLLLVQDLKSVMIGRKVCAELFRSPCEE